MAFPAIDVVQLLKCAAFSCAIHVIGNGRAPVLNGQPEHFEQAFMQQLSAYFRDAAGKSARVNTSGKQQFIGIDVANAPEECLVQQQGFDVAAMLMQTSIKLFKRNIESVGTDAIERFRKFVEELHAAELAHVVVDQRAVF